MSDEKFPRKVPTECYITSDKMVHLTADAADAHEAGLERKRRLEAVHYAVTVAHREAGYHRFGERTVGSDTYVAALTRELLKAGLDFTR